MSISIQLPQQPPTDDGKAHLAALHLLTLEAEIRRQPSRQDLLFHLVNSLHDLVPYGQAMAWRRGRKGGKFQLKVVSGLPVADRHTPLAEALQGLLAAHDKAGFLNNQVAFEVQPPGDSAGRSPLLDFALRHALWIPLRDYDGVVNTGALLLREQPFSPREQTLLQRLGETYGHALRVFGRQRRLLDRLPLSKRSLGIGAAIIVAAALIPVRLSVMAPVEVIADQPYVLTAPINGVIRNILVAPNTQVQANQALVQFEDIQPRNEMVLAQQQLAVAQAKDSRTSAAAFNDAEAAHELAIAAAEHDLARVNYEYTLEVLQRTLIHTPSAGLAVYSDRRDWQGRSVQVGEEIMQVADPERIAYRVDLSTGNAIELKPGNPVSIYLESAPLGGIKAELKSVSYTPKTTGGNQTSYTVMAMPTTDTRPRIGSRGTARVYGEYAPLAFQLLRRPIAAVRQYLGV
jgi:multidrug resistance efflux pump